MRLSTRGRYALRMMIELARDKQSDAPLSVTVIAEKTDISRGYLEQVALLLRNARLLRAVPGRHGGYRLARPAAEITVLEVIEASIGPISIVHCAEEPECCSRSDGCEAFLIYALVNHRIREMFGGYTLANLVDSRRIRSLRRTVEKLTQPRLHTPT